MARRKTTAGGASRVPLWLITYSDLMTLLLTFFVLLLSMAVIDERTKLTVLGSVGGTFGEGERLFNPLGKPEDGGMREPGAMDLPGRDLAPLRDMLFEDVEKDLRFMENKYVQILSINEQVLFAQGGAKLSPQGEILLDRLMPYLQHIGYPLLVAGHTASRRDEETSYAVVLQPGVLDSTWRLSHQRALSVYRHFLDRGMEPGRLSLEAFGQFRPRYSNEDPEGRQKNRRVDLVLDRRNLEWIRKVESLREAEPAKADHFYKGFKFDLTMPGESPPGGRP